MVAGLEYDVLGVAHTDHALERVGQNRAQILELIYLQLHFHVRDFLP